MKKAIIILAIFITSIFGVLGQEEISQADITKIVINLENIKIKLNDIKESVDQIVKKFEDRKSNDKAAAWKNVNVKIEAAQTDIDLLLKDLDEKSDVFTKKYFEAKLGVIENHMNEITRAAIKAASGKDYSGTVSDLKEEKKNDKKVQKTEGKYGTVKLDFYVMSQCPYGTQVEDGVKPALDKLGDSVDFNLNFIANDNGDGTFKSLHGENEVKGDIAQLCAAKYNPDKYMDMIVCMNKNAQGIPGNWEGCAIGLETEKIKTCYEGTEGKTLLSESIKKSEAVGASGSPTMFVNDQPYNGARDANSFLRALCQKLNGHPECSSIPACSTDADCTAQPDKDGVCENPGKSEAKCIYNNPVAVDVTILNDKKCTSCDTSGILRTTSQLFKGSKVKNVDINDDEGKKLIKDFGITVVPVYLFSESVIETPSWKNNARLGSAFEKKGIYYKLLDQVTQASHFVDEKAQIEFYSKIGVKKGDNKPQIDFFVMSYCPYGNQAEEGIEPVYQLLKNKAEFNPHYVIYSNYQGGGDKYCIDKDSLYCSMHGVQEMNQNIRELCVDKYMGTDKWFEFAIAMNKKCTAQNADSCWEAVAKDLKLDVTKIKDCQKNEALTLASKELELGNAFGASGSPAIFIDGEEYSGGRMPDSYKTSLCAAFETAPNECNQKLAGEDATQAAPSTAGCGV